jgi:malonyl CoA-acyl carrier protein transacylase
MAAGVPLPEVAAYSGHSVGELAAVAAEVVRIVVELLRRSSGLTVRR